MTLTPYFHSIIQGCVAVSNNGESGFLIQFANGASRLATPAEILAATKAARIEADRQECRRRLTEHYGDALEQVSRASGVYGVVAKANHAAGVDATIDATNVARDQINAATTIAQVEAVVVAWPVLT